MNGKLYKLKTIQFLVMIVISVSFIGIIVSPFIKSEFEYDKIEIDIVKKTVEKYVIQCYATEGSYPPNIDYLSEHYGLILDKDKYIYEYEAVAENISPVIRIFVNNGFLEE